jgi:hypothetical protein
VRHPADALLREQAQRFALRFACEDCAHFDAERARCVHGYIERPSVSDLEKPDGVITFCKEFELGVRDAP